MNERDDYDRPHTNAHAYPIARYDTNSRGMRRVRDDEAREREIRDLETKWEAS